MRIETALDKSNEELPYFENGAREFLNHIESTGVCSADEAESVEYKNTLEIEEQQLSEALKRLRPAFDQLTKWFVDPLRETSPSQAAFGYEKLWELMSASFVVGSRGTLTQRAEKFFNTASHSPGGKRSGEVRRSEADEGWRPHALELAKDIRDETLGSTMKKMELATEISKRWRLKIRCPKSMLTKAIRDWEKSGKLKSRNK